MGGRCVRRRSGKEGLLFCKKEAKKLLLPRLHLGVGWFCRVDGGRTSLGLYAGLDAEENYQLLTRLAAFTVPMPVAKSQPVPVPYAFR